MRRVVSGLIASMIIGSATLSAADYYATVNGDKITKEDVAAVIRNPQIDFDSLPENTKSRVIDQLIEKSLLASNALKSDVVKSSDFKEALKKLEKELALEFWMQTQYKAINVTQKDKKDFFNQHKEKFKEDAKLKASHILLKTEDEAKAVISELKKAPKAEIKTKFAELAKTKSIGPSKDNGGELGEFSPKVMVPEFSDAAMSLNVGEFSKAPVKTQFGYHVILLEDKQDEKVLSYEDVEEKLTQMITQERFTKVVKSKVAELKEKAKIEIKK